VIAGDPSAAPRQTLERFLSLHEPATFDEYLDMLHDECVFEAPFANVAGTVRVSGKANIIANSKGWLKTWKRATYVGITIRSTEEAGLFVVECGGDMVLPNGREYSNIYVCVARISEGKVILWREYYNPVVINEALAER
jgi:ketosteroid isomerase-like protein